MRTQPDFINIGPGRCGTSWLHETLAAHPEIGISRVKETEYFNTNYEKGPDWYESHFSHLSEQKVSGEVSNNYYLDPAVASRIRDYRPDIKLIINVRDPITLIRSFYNFGVRRGLDLPPIEQCLGEHIGRFMGSGYDYRKRRNCLTTADQVTLLDSVRLSKLVRPFLENFPSHQIFFFVYERFRHDPDELLGHVYRFLGVDSEFRPPTSSEIVNPSIRPRSRLLASYGSRVAFALRRLGAYDLLNRMHGSRTLKQLFFQPTGPAERGQTDVAQALPQDVVRDLHRERKAISAIVPEFDRYCPSWD